MAAAGPLCRMSGTGNMSVAANNPRTSPAEHAPQDRVNRLAGESSPYLFQHARNPVDWFPWSDEALQSAETGTEADLSLHRLLRLSLVSRDGGESFEDRQTADLLNEHFIAIKVDREERPDLDEIYMMAVQIMTGGGGWPLSVFLTPKLKPFFGGAYFPPEDRHGLPSFKTVLRAVAELWQEQPDRVARSAGEIAQTLRAGMCGFALGGPLDASLLSHAVVELTTQFDATSGGFGGPPKFPDTGAIALLLRQHMRTGNAELLKMVAATLDHMAFGGIHDQIGGGFHRYTVDARWLTPHFEKMLYDNALLAATYLEAWQAAGKDLYRRVASGYSRLRAPRNERFARRLPLVARRRQRREGRKVLSVAARRDSVRLGRSGWNLFLPILWRVGARQLREQQYLARAIRPDRLCPPPRPV